MKIWKWPVIIVGTFLVSLFLGMLVTVIYPSSMELGAPWLCPDDKPDPFVVRYNVQTSDGTGTNFTLFCLSERGEPEEVGTWLPMLVVSIIVAGVIVAFIVALRLVGFLRRIGRDRGPPDAGDPADGFGAPEADPFAAIRSQQGPIID